MLHIDRVVKSYGSVTVLHAVTLAALSGRVTGLIGPNGSGKSTLLHVLAGLHEADSGRVTIGGHPLGTAPARAMTGFGPDDLPMPDLLTAREYLVFVQGLRGLDVPADALHLMVSGLRLEGRLDALIGGYSHGMRRKLQLIATLMHLPPLLVLDEPLRGLDPESAALLRTLIERYARLGNAVLFATHDLAVAERICSDIVVLADGRVVAQGPTRGVVGGHRDLESSFLVRTGLDRRTAQSAEAFFEGLGRLPGRG